jgi:hypothetical protein
MKAKATNLGLLCGVVLAFLTGWATYLAGSPIWQPVVWAHALAGLTVAALFFWKRRIVRRSLRRRGFVTAVAPGVLLLALVLAAVASGLGWSTIGLPAFDGYSALTIHAALGTLAVVCLLAHARLRWPRVRFSDRPGRRETLRFGAVALTALVVWRGAEGAAALFGLSGAKRRFTGSRAVLGTDFPATQWLFDNPDPLDQTAWRLALTGHVRQPLALSLASIDAGATLNATLDCTGGWYTERVWQGVTLAELLDRAAVTAGARSIVVRASTGYWRRYTVAAARGMLIATRVDGLPLEHGHGAPARLVVPAGRGYEWVKWVTAIEVSAAPAWWRWPLPV